MRILKNVLYFDIIAVSINVVLLSKLVQTISSLPKLPYIKYFRIVISIDERNKPSRYSHKSRK